MKTGFCPTHRIRKRRVFLEERRYSMALVHVSSSRPQYSDVFRDLFCLGSVVSTRRFTLTGSTFLPIVFFYIIAIKQPLLAALRKQKTRTFFKQTRFSKVFIPVSSSQPRYVQNSETFSTGFFVRGTRSLFNLPKRQTRHVGVCTRRFHAQVSPFLPLHLKKTDVKQHKLP